MKIYIGSDHTGYEQKKEIINYFSELGYEVVDKGAFSYKEGDDYPDFVIPVAESVASNGDGIGVVLGGSGQGEAMCANKVKGVRAMVFYGEEVPQEPVDISGRRSVDSFEIIKLARKHNNANVLSLATRFLSLDEMKFAIELFISTEFENDGRHIRRINKF